MSMEDQNENVTLAFIWKIENFSHCLQTTGERLESPEFFIGPILWRLYVYPKGKEDDEQVNFFLSSEDMLRLGMTSDEFYFDFQLSPLDANGSIMSKNVDHGNIHSNRNFNSVPDLHSVTKDTYYQKDVYETKRYVYLPNDTLTLFCRVWKVSSQRSDAQFFARTRLGFQKVSKLWNIPNFSKLQTGDSRITRVYINHLLDTNIHLDIISKLRPGYRRCIRKRYLKIHINHESQNKKILLSCTLSVLNQDKKPFKERRYERIFFPKENLNWSIQTFINEEELVEGESNLLPGDELSLKFEFTIYSGVVHEEIESARFEPMPNQSEDSVGTRWNPTQSAQHWPPTDSVGSRCNPTQSAQHCPPTDSEDNLNTDLLSLYQEKTLSDFELRSKGVAFPVHKAVLCARSPALKAMLTGNMEEVTTNCLQVTDIDPETMTRLLLYVYTDKMEDLDLDSVCKLFYASDKYEILSLRQKCSSSLKSHLSVDNVSIVLLLADRHQDDELKSAVYDFLGSHDKEIMQSTEWVEFDKTNSSLAAKTMYEVYKRKLQIK